MKLSDVVPDTQTGKFISRAHPLGTVTEEMVVRRARELAVVNGREGKDYTDEDLEEARRELTGFTGADASEEAASPETIVTGEWQGEAVDHGHKVPVRGAPDEQTFGEELVREGVDEATHHQMLAGNEESRRADAIEGQK